MKRAKTYEEIRPLIQMCKCGRLFDVQRWISERKPINPPAPPKKGRRPRSPLQYAIDTGFHSLVQVLLEAGAQIENTWRYSALDHALREEYHDITALLLDHGAKVTASHMHDAFRTWDSDLIVNCIEHGGDVETGNPLAQALCDRIKPALKIYKRYKDRFPSFHEQTNIALRYHCRDGNLKWVSLMLWAGADPDAKGTGDPEYEPRVYGSSSAYEIAILHGHFEALALLGKRVDPKYERAHAIVREARIGRDVGLLKRLFDMGYPANDQANGGSSHVQDFISDLDISYGSPTPEDSARAREKIKTLYVLVQGGARWMPKDRSQLGRVRRSLLKLNVHYTVEVIWIMAKYGACDRSVIETLLKTPAMCGHVAMYTNQIEQLMKRLPTKSG